MKKRFLLTALLILSLSMFTHPSETSYPLGEEDFPPIIYETPVLVY